MIHAEKVAKFGMLILDADWLEYEPTLWTPSSGGEIGGLEELF